MKLLNLCCGAVRLSIPWTNLDTLRSVLAEGTPERANLDAEPNYVDFDVLSGPLPFEDNTFDGILASHCVEHWDCHEAVRVLRECRRVLVPGGVLVVSVPNAAVFRKEHEWDCVENAERIFGEPIHLADGETTFMGYALFNRYHKQVLCEDALWCLLKRAGFNVLNRPDITAMYRLIAPAMNRRLFSLEMGAWK